MLTLLHHAHHVLPAPTGKSFRRSYKRTWPRSYQHRRCENLPTHAGTAKSLFHCILFILTRIASRKQNKAACDLFRTEMLCYHSSSTTRWYSLLTTGRRSISSLSYRRQRRSTCLHALTLVRGTTWHLARTTRMLLSVGYFGKLCGEGSRVAKTRICLRTF